jgi:hypothetical protein
MIKTISLNDYAFCEVFYIVELIFDHFYPKFVLNSSLFISRSLNLYLDNYSSLNQLIVKHYF